MSESESYEEVTVTSDGITVIKTFEEDAFPVPAIAFRIQSDRTKAVSITLVDDVPENVAVEDLGFHPEYGSEFWTIEDDEITFEREIASEEQYTTVYGIRATGTDNIEQFLTEPDIAEVDPPLEDDGGVVGGGSDVVRDVISGDTDSVPGLDEDDDDIGTLDLADPNDEAEEEPAAEVDDEDDEAEEEPAVEVDDEEQTAQPDANGQAASIESVAAALADEIREGEVDDDDMDVLRDELEIEVVGGSGGGGTEGGATDARIRKLQTDVSDLEAYIDALEEFLEENGTGQDLISDVQEGLEDVQGQLDGIQTDVDDNSEQVSALDDGLGEFEDDLRSLKGDIKDLDDSLEDVERTLGSVEDDVEDIDDIESRVDDVDKQIEDLQEWREQLSNVLGAADSD